MGEYGETDKIYEDIWHEKDISRVASGDKKRKKIFTCWTKVPDLLWCSFRMLDNAKSKAAAVMSRSQ